ncbi:MAG: hypothetical protein JWR33_1161 [Naasia sp.]|nr:hypothetical protein [Naasia sp.]
MKKVNELDFCNPGHGHVVSKVGLTPNKTTAAINLLGIKNDPDCSKSVRLGKSQFQRYSRKAVERIRALVEDIGPDEIWLRHKAASKPE